MCTAKVLFFNFPHVTSMIESQGTGFIGTNIFTTVFSPVSFHIFMWVDLLLEVKSGRGQGDTGIKGGVSFIIL